MNTLSTYFATLPHNAFAWILLGIGAAILMQMFPMGIIRVAYAGLAFVCYAVAVYVFVHPFPAVA